MRYVYTFNSLVTGRQVMQVTIARQMSESNIVKCKLLCEQFVGLVCLTETKEHSRYQTKGGQLLCAP